MHIIENDQHNRRELELENEMNWKLWEFAIQLREAKQELLKDHEERIPLEHMVLVVLKMGARLIGEDDDTVDEDYDSSAHEIGQPADKEHPHKPGGDSLDVPLARVLHPYDSNVWLL